MEMICTGPTANGAGEGHARSVSPTAFLAMGYRSTPLACAKRADVYGMWNLRASARYRTVVPRPDSRPGFGSTRLHIRQHAGLLVLLHRA